MKVSSVKADSWMLGVADEIGVASVEIDFGVPGGTQVHFRKNILIGSFLPVLLVCQTVIAVVILWWFYGWN